MQRIGITEWAERYEVSNDGRPLTSGGIPRKAALDYIRLPVKADKWGPGWRRMMRLSRDAGLDPATTFGVFCKLLEFAGAGLAGSRGFVRNDAGTSANPREFAELAGFDPSVVEAAIRILSEIRWIFVEDEVCLAATECPKTSDKPARTRENPREPAPTRDASRTKRNETKHNTNERLAGIRENPREAPGTREPDSDAALDSPSPRSSRLVNFGCPGLRAILGSAVKGKADAKVVADIERQVGGLGPDRIADVERQAVKIMGGKSRNPLAVFVAAMKEQGYYRPNGGDA